MNPNTSTNKISTKDIVFCAIFVTLTAICSWITIPTVVPFTLQTFAIFLAVGILGGKKGTISVIVYTLLGLVGVPVFAGFTGGVAKIIGPTGGYIVGFILSALVMWLFEVLFGRKIWSRIASMILGLLICYAFGTVWFIEIYTRKVEAINLASALKMCVIPFIIPDLLKIAAAFILSDRLYGTFQKIYQQ